MIMQSVIKLLRERSVFFRGSFLLAFTTGLGYLIGLFRDRTFAYVFGASRSLDAYHAAFIIPDLLLNIFVAGALTAAFVPIFTQLRAKKENVHTFVNTVLNASVSTMAVGAVIIWFFASPLASVVAPGFDAQAHLELVSLMRILLLSPIIFALSNTFGTINVSRQQFFWYGMSGVLYNAGTVAGILYFGATFGIKAAAWGTVAGAVLHLIVRLFGNRDFIRNYRPSINYDGNFREFLRIMLPKMIGQPIEQYTMLGFTIIASTIGTGTIVVLEFARNFQSMPINFIGATLAMTAFPTLSSAIAEADWPRFKKETYFALKSILLASIPAALILYLFKVPLISILLGGGAFDADAIALTARTLGFFALSVPTECVSQLYSRAFYAQKNSITPVMITLVGLGISIFSGWWLSKSMGAPGLAIGFFIGSAIKTILLVNLLKTSAS